MAKLTGKLTGRTPAAVSRTALDRYLSVVREHYGIPDGPPSATLAAVNNKLDAITAKLRASRNTSALSPRLKRR